jgi:DNA (cytosine-5)-methyltransferase 1
MTVLSTFSGTGGLDLGLEYAGFETLGSIEQEEAPRLTLRRNRPNWRHIEPHEIVAASNFLRPSDLGLRKRELGVLAGGPPCQPFSKAAQYRAQGRQGLEDPRSKCLDGLLRIVETFLPKVILLENVSGFLSGRGSALPHLEHQLQQINSKSRTHYELQYRVVNAADYGVPQSRRRAIAVARRDGRPFLFPEPTHVGCPVVAGDALRETLGTPRPRSGYWADLLPSIPEGKNYLWHTNRGGGKPIFPYRAKYWSFLLKLAKDQPSWTIAASPGPSTGPFHWDDRPLTPEEMMRLQSFPVSWKLEGEYRQRIRQAGNATPPLLAEVVGRAIAEQVFGEEYQGLPELRIPRRRTMPTKSPVQRVPAKYQEHIGAHPDHGGTGKGPCPGGIGADTELGAAAK